MATALVAGANGYIGFAISKALRREGWKVYGSVRNEENGAELRANEIIPVIVDFQKDLAHIAPLLREVSVVIDTHSSGSWDSNRKLHDVLAAASQPLSHKTYIYCSGILVHGHHDQIVDEDTPLHPTPILSGRVKFEEYIVQHPQVNGIVVRPGFVYGGSGGNFTWWHIQPETPIRGIPTVQWSWVHLDDLAQAFVLVAQKRSSLRGEVFDVAGKPIEYQTLRTAMARVGGSLKADQKLTFEPLNDQERAGWPGSMFQTVIISGIKARDVLGWTPKHLGYLEELSLYYQIWLTHQASKKVESK